jgi:tyrosyl-tRNA synthetase
MSKSKGNAIGIMDAPREMFGKVMSISDELMAAWYPMLLGTNARLADPNHEKQALAQTLVARFHGASVGAEVLAWWHAGRPADDEVAEVQVAAGPLFQVVRDAGGAKSGSDARRKIEQGGVRLGGERALDPAQKVTPGHHELEVGKKFKVRLLVVS